MANTNEQGFTLIELMIVVAIIGILAAIAIPAYQSYIARAQASEALQLLSGAKSPLTEYYSDRGIWPTDPDDVGINTGGRFVLDSAEFAGGGTTALTLTVRATFRSDEIASVIRGKKLLLETVDGGRMWICRRDSGPDGIDNRYLPSACR